MCDVWLDSGSGDETTKVEKAEVCLAKQRQSDSQTVFGRETGMRDIMANNSSNCSFAHEDDLIKIFEPVFYIPIFIVGLILNVAALAVFCFFLRKWTESTIYMTNLVLMDLLILFPLPFKMHATNHKWPRKLQPLCSVLEGFYFYGIYGSIYIIMCIAADRWMAICHPFKARQLRSKRVTLVACIGVWILVLAAITPPIQRFSEGRIKRNESNFHCFHEFSEKGWSPKIIINLQVFGFLVPALVVVFCSIQTIWKLQKSGQRSAQSRACVKIIYSSLCAFLLPFTPSHFAIFLQFLVHEKIIEDCEIKKSISLFLQIVMCLSNITCCLDGLCYYFIAHEVRSTRHSFRMSIMTQRRTTVSSSEV